MSVATTSKAAHAARQSLQAMYLINDLLDIEKLESGEIPLFLMAADLRELLDTALRDLISDVQERDISVDVNASDITVFVDKEQFVRVLRNCCAARLVAHRQGLPYKYRQQRKRVSVS